MMKWPSGELVNMHVLSDHRRPRAVGEVAGGKIAQHLLVLAEVASREMNSASPVSSKWWYLPNLKPGTPKTGKP